MIVYELNSNYYTGKFLSILDTDPIPTNYTNIAPPNFLLADQYAILEGSESKITLIRPAFLGDVNKKQIVSSIPSVSSNAVIPYSTNIPLPTDGIELIKASIVTRIGSHILLNIGFIYELTSTNRQLIVTLLRNGEVISVFTDAPNNNKPCSFLVNFVDISSAELVTYSVRAGCNVSSTWKINKNDGTTGSFGGLLFENGFTITELPI